jgi:SAM-dependent methyltransferase
VNTATDFDSFADSYDRALNEALAATGEDGRYFAQARVKWLAGCLRRLAFAPRRLMDYGCGTGATSALLLKILGAESIVGVDLSQRSLELARQNHGSDRVQFSPIHEYRPAASLDFAYTNGVFHHIPPRARGTALDFLCQSLRPGGLFSFWENNPWNLGTRYVMANCIFDRDAITLTPVEAKQLLRSGGFAVLRTDFLFIFPRSLRMLRPAEKLLSVLPLGAQYHILCQKPIQRKYSANASMSLNQSTPNHAAREYTDGRVSSMIRPFQAKLQAKRRF